MGGFRSESGTLEFPINAYFEVVDLPQHVKQKWSRRQSTTGSHSSRVSEDGCLGSNNKTSASEEVRYYGVADDFEAWQRKVARELEERMALAENNRQNSIDERRRKATKVLKAAERVVAQQEAQNEQIQLHKAARINAKLEQAERLREQLNAGTAQKLCDMLARAKAGSELARQREAGRGLKRQADLDFRLQKAEGARYEKLQTVASSLSFKGSEGFLVRRSLARCYLRRQSSSRVIQRYWREFVIRRRTTAELISSFEDQGLLSHNKDHEMTNEGEDATSQGPNFAVFGMIGPNSAQQGEDPFDNLAAKISSPSVIKSTDRLLIRLQRKLPAFRKKVPGLDSILKRVKPPTRRRYPTRIFNSAFMICQYPEVIFSRNGERENNLRLSALDMIGDFKALTKSFHQTVKHHPRRMSTSSHIEPSSRTYDGPSPAESLCLFDASWIIYLEQFIAWQTADAANLEADLVKAAVDLETSKIATLNRSPSRRPRSAADREAVIEQVDRDHALLRERVLKLSGQAGLSRFEAALTAARAPSNPSTPLQSPGRTPQTSPERPPLPSSSSPARSSSLESPQRAISSTNEPLAWELLYNIHFQISTSLAEKTWSDAVGETDAMQEEVSGSENKEETGMRITRITERAFYDRLKDSPPEQIASLLSDLGQQLTDTLPPRNPQIPKIKEHLSKDKLEQEISEGSLQALIPAFDLLADVVLQSGAVERENSAQIAHQGIREELRNSGGDVTKISFTLVKALRMINAQLQLLSIDTMNVHLNSLRGHFRGGLGTEYARDKFMARLGINTAMSVEQLSEKLPQSRAWLARGATILPALQINQETSRSSSVPSNLRTGRAQDLNVPSSQPQSESGVNFVRDTSQEAWRQVVRISMVNLVTGNGPNSGDRNEPEIPETLHLDQGRLSDVKDMFDRTLIIATSTILCSQGVSENNMPDPDLSTLTKRLEEMIEREDMSLNALASELAKISAPEENQAERITQLESLLQKMLSRNSASCKALVNGLGKVIQRELILGPSEDSVLQSSLSKFGARHLTSNYQNIVKKLQSICAVSEAVHGPIYQSLLTGLI